MSIPTALFFALLTLGEGRAAPVSAAPSAPIGGAVASAPMEGVQAEAQRFLDTYNSLYKGLSTVVSEAYWAASTNVGAESEGKRVAAAEAWAAFVGDPGMIMETRRLLAQRSALTPLQVRQLERILVLAAAYPGTLPKEVKALIAAEARAAAIQDGFVYCLEVRRADGSCPSALTANDLGDRLESETDLNVRAAVWTESKSVGKALKGSLTELRGLRNQIARSMGYTGFFGYMTADYGLSAKEMMGVLDGIVKDVQPLYRALTTWGGNQLARKYKVGAPQGPIPAHWLPNRWGQEWGGLVPGVDLNPYFKDRSPEWIVKTSEEFYVSMGFEPLPASFYELSDLYPVPEGDPRQKNGHASAWHINLDHDVRSLMSVKPDANWFFTSHHELGHIYYDLSYTRPEVPPLLREGANRAFHEGIGELISIAAGQVPYLHDRGILPKSVKVNPTQAMLEEALTKTVVFLPWSAGVMSRFEYELYEEDLPPEKFQERWWALVGEAQGFVPPDPARLRDPDLCDACTKTHIIDDPGGYYDYALATIIKHQLHEKIARDILKQDPHACNYYGNKEVGAYLKSILEKGATQDWRVVLKEATGEELSSRAMLEYYAPLQKWLEKENKHAR